MLNNIVQIILIVIAVERLTELLVDSEISQITIRSWLNKLSDKYFESVINDNTNYLYWIPAFIYKILQCGYCTSVWVAVVFSIMAPKIFENMIFQFIIMTLFLHGGSNLFHVVYELIRRGRVNSIDISLTYRRHCKSEDDS